MAYGKVEICGINTAKLKTLRESEKAELLKKVKQGDMKAREALICGNLRLVLSVIQRFVNRGENLDDLFQIGSFGLIQRYIAAFLNYSSFLIFCSAPFSNLETCA